jgi:hypothetical protein
MKTLKYLVAAIAPATAIGWLLMAASIASAEPAGAVFPGNEAVRIVDGKRVVEAPPLTAASQRYVKGGAKLPPPSAGGEVFMIEAPEGLVECRGTYLSSTGCVPSSLGTTTRARLWTVKLAGQWLHCDSRAASRKCEPAAAGAPGAMGTVE